MCHIWAEVRIRQRKNINNASVKLEQTNVNFVYNNIKAKLLSENSSFGWGTMTLRFIEFSCWNSFCKLLSKVRKLAAEHDQTCFTFSLFLGNEDKNNFFCFCRCFNRWIKIYVLFKVSEANEYLNLWFLKKGYRLVA